MQSKPLAVAIGSNIGGSLYDQWVDESREPWLVVHLLIAALIQLLRMENRCRYNLGDIWLIKPMPYAHNIYIYNFAKESNSNMIIFNSLRQPQRPSCEGDVQQRQQHQQEQQQQQQRQQHHDNSSSSNDNSNSNNGSSNSNSSISSISTATAATATGDNRNSNSNCSSTTAIRSTATMATAKACKSKGRQQKQQQ